MSKNFEEEYKEYLNAQAPDLWGRIEAGVDAMGAPAGLMAVAAGAEKVVPISAGEAKKAKKKRQIRYQNYRMLASVAACLFALVLIVPVYFLTQNSGKDAADSAAPQELADITIQNIEAESAENTHVTEDSAPMEDMADGVTQVQIALEDTDESVTEFAQVTEEMLPESSEPVGDISDETEGESGAVVASGEIAVTGGTDALSEAAEEESVPAQEDMQITIVGEGAAQEGGVMYTAAIVDSASSATISLLVPAESATVLEADKVYDVTVELSEDGTYYVAVSVTAAE